MSDERSETPPLTQIDSKSSMFEKVHPNIRRQIDQALIDRQPATYKAVYDKFSLHAMGVSYTAFYCYASRLRANAAFIGLAQITLPEGAAVNNMLPELLGQRLFEAALDEETSAATLYRLAHTYRIANEAYYAKRRFTAQLEDQERRARAKENDDFLRMANQLIHAQANEDFIKSHVAHQAQAAVKSLVSPPIQPRSVSDGDASASGRANDLSPIRAPAEATRMDATEHDSVASARTAAPSLHPAQHSALGTQHSSPAAPAKRDDNLDLLNRYLVILERYTKTREQALQSKPLAATNANADSAPIRARSAGEGDATPITPHAPTAGEGVTPTVPHAAHSDTTGRSALHTPHAHAPAHASSFIRPPFTSPGEVKGQPSSFFLEPAAFTTLAPSIPRTTSPTSLSERRHELRRQRRRERHRKRRA
ncbi:MAG TPA: hypothetical protein VMV94_00430 [Phycisphaerae bacterium]|nr:hypothetical protein [Phycisphaerae bacterium]